LILDEWLLFPLKESEARDLLEIIESRYKKASIIFCSQFEVAGCIFIKIYFPKYLHIRKCLQNFIQNINYYIYLISAGFC